MTSEIQCSRTDCDFHYLGGCGYGGSAVQISERGCRTYEPAGQTDGANMMPDTIKPFKIGDCVRTFKSALIEGEGKIYGIADNDYPDCDDFFIVDFGERGTCTVHKDDMELL